MGCRKGKEGTRKGLEEGGERTEREGMGGERKAGGEGKGHHRSPPVQVLLVCKTCAYHVPFEATEDADFPKFYADPIGVAGVMAKIKIAYNLVIQTGIPAVCMTCPFGVMPGQINRTCFMHIDSL